MLSSFPVVFRGKHEGSLDGALFKFRRLCRLRRGLKKDLANKSTITTEKNRAHPFPARRGKEPLQRRSEGAQTMGSCHSSGAVGGHARWTPPPPPPHSSAAMTSEPAGSPGEVRVKGERWREPGVFPAPHCLPDNLSSRGGGD